jgi:hypothetical protein
MICRLQIFVSFAKLFMNSRKMQQFQAFQPFSRFVKFFCFSLALGGARKWETAIRLRWQKDPRLPTVVGSHGKSLRAVVRATEGDP